MNTFSTTPVQNYARDNQNCVYQVALKTLSPVHIGTLEEKKWHKGMDYLYLKEKVYIINPNRLLPLLPKKYGFSLEFKDIENFLNEVANNKIANHSLESLSYFVSNLRYTNQEPIRPMITTGFDLPYIPGSSLKGAIRSVLFKYWHKKSEGDKERKSSELEEKVFGKIENNLMKFLIIGDTHFNWKETELYNSKIFNVYPIKNEWVTGWKHARKGGNDSRFNERDFTTALHCIQPLQSGILQMVINKNLLKMGLTHSVKGKKIQFSPYLKNSYLEKEKPLEELFAIINNHTRQYLEREVKFYETFRGAEYQEELLDYLKKLLKHVSNLENLHQKAIIRLGWGGGFHSITGDWQYSDHTLPIKQNAKNKYKTRRWLFSNFNGNLKFYLPGFVELSILSGKEEAEALRKRITLPKRVEEAQPLEREVSSASSPEVIEITPPAYKGKLREGAKDIPAKVISQVGKEVTFELLLEGGNQQAKASYASPLEIGSWHYVSIKTMNKGKIERVDYQKRF